MATVAGMHRRKSSREEDEGIVLASNGALQSPQNPVLNGFASAKPSTHDDVPATPASTAADLSPQRSRVNSAPIASSSPSPPSHSAYVPPPTAGPFQKSFAVPPPPRPGPNGHHHHRPAGSPLRASLSLPSHLQVNAHTRTRSVSGSPFAPALPSPLSMSFPTSSSDHDSSDRPVPMSASAAEFPRAGGHTRTVSYSHPHAHSHSPLHTSGHHHSHHPHAQVGVHTQPQPQLHSHNHIPNHIPPPIHTHTPNGTAQHDAPPSPTVANAHARRHSRLHSRNLSIYFPRPGSLPHASIAEDGTQEVEFPTSASEPAPVTTLPSPGPRKLGEGFTFGARPPPDAFPSSPSLPSAPGASRSRRGHHHKHSLSHNFFSFLEPGEGADLHTQPTPVPVSPWNPISPFPESARPEVTSFGVQQHTHDHGSHGHEHHDHDHDHDHGHDHDNHRHEHDHDHDHDHRPSSPSKTRGRTMVFTTRPSDVGAAPMPPSAIVAATGTFALGAWLWIAGQQVGSLACTGLGYWVVFDAFGVGIARILPPYMRRPSMQSPVRRPYGNSRLEAVVLFAQAVYLLFSAVYVFKECVEHLLLSAGGEGDHHHHPGDEEVNLYGIDFPLLILMTTFLTLVANCLLFRNHSKLMNISGTKLPSLASIFDPARYKYASRTTDSTSLPERIWENPFSSIPIIISLAIFLIPTIIPPSQHRGLDLLLASAEAIAMFYLAYPSCVTIGAVLLQTSPPRGHASGRMEAFLRAMREIERHPQVQHLPPPHIWQLTPTEDDPAKSLIVTLELRVAHDLADEDVLKLTKWAWERCVNALGLNREDAKEGGGGVTVGVVRG